MKNIKHLTMLVIAALISVSISAQTETKPVAKTQPSTTKSSMLTPKTTLKMQPPTKLPVAAKPVKPAADTKAQPAKPADGTTK
jgi:hypothetical protein